MIGMPCHPCTSRFTVHPAAKERVCLEKRRRGPLDLREGAQKGSLRMERSGMDRQGHNDAAALLPQGSGNGAWNNEAP